MKRTLLFILILLITMFTGCYTAEDQNNFNEQMNIPMNSNYILFSTKGFVKDNHIYYFDNICLERLEKEGINVDSLSELDMETIYTLYEKHVFIRFTFYKKYENNISSYKYMCGIYNFETLEFEHVVLNESIDYEIKISKLDNYAVLIYDDLILFTDIYTKEQNKFELIDYNYVTKSLNGIVLKNKSDNLYYLLNHELSLNVIDIGTDAKVSSVDGKYMICYYDNYERIAYNLEDNTIISYKDFIAIKEENYSQCKIIERNETYNTFKILINGEEYSYDMEEIRTYCDEINQVEQIFNTTVHFKGLEKFNNEHFITIGNDDSFFGMYSSGSTLPMVFKIEDDRKLSYIGCLPNIYDYLIYIIKR